MECPDGYGACTNLNCGHIQSLDDKPTCQKCKSKIDTHCDIIIKLKKAIYGLKQSPRDWYDTIVGWLTKPTKEGRQGQRSCPGGTKPGPSVEGNRAVASACRVGLAHAVPRPAAETEGLRPALDPGFR